MAGRTINLSLRSDLMSKIDRLAKKECRSRSELLREAAREYVERRQGEAEMFATLTKHAKSIGISEADIAEEIRLHRMGR